MLSRMSLMMFTSLFILFIASTQSAVISEPLPWDSPCREMINVPSEESFTVKRACDEGSLNWPYPQPYSNLTITWKPSKVMKGFRVCIQPTSIINYLNGGAEHVASGQILPLKKLEDEVEVCTPPQQMESQIIFTVGNARTYMALINYKIQRS